MEEVDRIIIHSLKSVGCNIEDDISSLRDFSVELVVESTARCLLRINDQLDVPLVLPQSMSTRFRVGSDLAAACQDIGYQGDIGYQTFLYANEHDLRKVFMFLIEKLPKEASSAIDEPFGQGVLLSNRIAAEIKKQLSVPWTPPYCKKGNVVHIDNTDWFFQGCSTFHKMNTCKIAYPNSRQGKKEASLAKFVTSQPKESEYTHSSIHEENLLLLTLENEWDNEWNQLGIATRLSKEEYIKQKKEKLLNKVKEKILSISDKLTQSNKASATGLPDLMENMTFNDKNTDKVNRETKFTRVESLIFSQNEKNSEEDVKEVTLKREEIDHEETEEERQQKRENEILNLKDSLTNLTQNIGNMQQEINQVNAQIDQLNELGDGLQKSNKEEESSYKVKRKTMDLLPDAEENLKRLEDLVEASTKRLENLNDQWEKHRAPLMEQHKILKEQRSLRVSDIDSKIEQIRILREKMKETADETRSKEDLYKQLVEEYGRMTKDSNRSAYTKRILEIVGNIKKQKDQIAKVLLDTKSLQKDINLLNGKLERTFTVTDELIFRNAKSDEFSRKAYKLLASLHEGFGTLVQTVEDTGFIMREIRDVEIQVGNMNETEVEENFDKISKDLQQIKNENNEYIAKYKKSKR